MCVRGLTAQCVTSSAAVVSFITTEGAGERRGGDAYSTISPGSFSFLTCPEDKMFPVCVN